MDHLTRPLAPITDETWDALDDEARTRLQPVLGARRLVDFAGPLGWQHSSTNTGRVRPVGDDAGLRARQRVVLPLTEVRADFALARTELDDTARGAVDTDLSALDEAAHRLAVRENAAILTGWPEVGFAGIVPSSPHSPIDGSGDATGLTRRTAEAVRRLGDAGVGGPYGMAVGSSEWVEVLGGNDAGGQPLRRHIERILGGDVVWTPGIQGAVVISLRGGDFLLEMGQDVALGYSATTEDRVQLYLEESFSFRIATPEAAIALLPGTDDD
ncbi:family 1 encapsulin nanocompartment shell protein [Microbacterium proteolyticum]|nr:family 1 encapsulin nanocompartment shell protein [Microbacterium proteolyticum]